MRCPSPPPRACSRARSVRGGDEAGDALHAPSFRLRLLASLAAAIAAAKVGLGGLGWGGKVWVGVRASAGSAASPHLCCRIDACVARPDPLAQDKLLDRAPGAFGGYRGGRREAGLLAAACEAYGGALLICPPAACLPNEPTPLLSAVVVSGAPGSTGLHIRLTPVPAFHLRAHLQLRRGACCPRPRRSSWRPSLRHWGRRCSHWWGASGPWPTERASCQLPAGLLLSSWPRLAHRQVLGARNAPACAYMLLL